MNRETEVATLDEPQVFIYDNRGEVREEIRGEEGRLVPREIEVVETEGVIEIKKIYDWVLEGEVFYNSADGQQIRSPSMHYNGELGMISAEGGVVMTIQIESGDPIQMSARRLAATLDPMTRSISQLTFEGFTRFSSIKE
jgi:hypothetical protein